MRQEERRKLDQQVIVDKRRKERRNCRKLLVNMVIEQHRKRLIRKYDNEYNTTFNTATQII